MAILTTCSGNYGRATHTKCTNLYNPEGEQSMAWNDPDLGIEWPVETPQFAAKDAVGGQFVDLCRAKKIHYINYSSQQLDITFLRL
jgi:hypothetical protein